MMLMTDDDVVSTIADPLYGANQSRIDCRVGMINTARVATKVESLR